MLSRSQPDLLAQPGEERTAPVDEVLFQVGDEIYPFIAIGEGATVVRFVGEHMTKLREERQTAAGSA